MIGLYDGRKAMVGDQGGVSIICLMDLTLQRQYYSGSKPDAAGFCAGSRTKGTDTVRHLPLATPRPGLYTYKYMERGLRTYDCD
ncbi:hypothetical protein LI328DRAFT_98085 [Trichoderma asperelloides]|nr:hypothetical protein LI328DRAFT_98085 [Trichoderma asperelloides]